MSALKEYTPLMYTAEPQTGKVQELRSWRFPLWRTCGDFSPEDMTAGCLACHSPVIAFGWNMRRALQRSFWREVLKVVLLLGGAYLLLSLAAHGLILSCALGPQDGGGDGDGMQDPSGMPGVFQAAMDSHSASNGTDPQNIPHDGPHGGPGQDGPDSPHGPHPFDFNALPAECRGRVIGGMVVLLLAATVVVGFAVVYAARRRQQMREQFGIVGSFRRDVLTWLFCAPCALAQETRTLMGAQVHDGVWYGALPGAALSGGQGVPSAQQMV